MKTINLEELDIQAKDKKRVIPNLGISEDQRHKVSQHLNKILADSYCLMMMTQNYHWNVRGSMFRDIHLMTEEHYQNLFPAIDELAERIRSLGFNAPGTLKDFNDNTEINLPNAELSGEEMLIDLLEGHEVIIKGLRKGIEESDQVSDDVTADLLTDRMAFHEKSAWMIRSFLEK